MPFGRGLRILWIASLVLAGVCGFAYGWENRLENPPMLNMIKGKEPPELVLLRKGRYDEAAKTILDSISDEKEAPFKYQEVATIYAVRAAKDPSKRERWAQRAAFYEAKSVTASGNEPIILMGAASGLDHIGDVSGEPCEYYTTAIQYAQQAMDGLKSDAIYIGDDKTPTKPLRDDVGKLLDKLQGKIKTRCSGKRDIGR